MKRSQPKLSSVLIGLAVLTAMPACTKSAQTPASAPAADVIRVGTVGSLTGAEATFGTNTLKGVELAAKELNAKGGLDGKKLVVVPVDDRGKPEEAAIAARKLVSESKVQTIIGENASSISLAIAPIAQEAHVPMISPSSTNPQVTKAGNYIFRVCFIDPFQGTVMARFAAETLKARKVAILRDVKNDYSVGLANYFTDTFKKLGGEIVIDQSYSAGDVDFKAQLTAIRGKSPDAIFVPGYYTDVALVARQSHELGIKAPLLGGDGWDSPKLTEIGGSAMDGSYFSNHYSAENPDPAIQAFVRDYKQAYGEVPDAVGLLGYEALKLFADAYLRAHDKTGPAIREALAATRDFPAVSGKFEFDSDRNPRKAAVVLKVQGGQFKYQATISPGGGK
jgi:branched-chain amino acid transport system substrate-binding protein